MKITLIPVETNNPRHGAVDVLVTNICGVSSSYRMYESSHFSVTCDTTTIPAVRIQKREIAPTAAVWHDIRHVFAARFVSDIYAKRQTVTVETTLDTVCTLVYDINGNIVSKHIRRRARA